MRYTALLRGINVSGQKIIKMADLSALFTGCGFTDVTTYIQSGNVIFSAGRGTVQQHTRTIEDAIQSKYGFEVPVLLVKKERLNKAVNNNLLLKQHPGTDTGSLYIAYLYNKPTAGADVLQTLLTPGDILLLDDDLLYFYCPGGAGKSKLNNNSIEKKLGTTATTRNYNTSKVLLEMMEG